MRKGLGAPRQAAARGRQTQGAGRAGARRGRGRARAQGRPRAQGGGPRAGLRTPLALVPGQALLLVLNELEQRGLDLLHLGNLVENQLTVLARRFDGQPAEQPSSRSIGPCENETSLIRINGKSRPDLVRMPYRRLSLRVVSW